MRRCMSLIVLMLFFVVAIARAQFDVMGMMRNQQYGALALLSRSELQKELKLTKSQNDSLRKLQKEQGEETTRMSKDVRASDPSAVMNISKQMESISNEYSNKALDVLNPDQRKRFGEIRIQVLGPQAAFDSDIQAALATTDAQKEALDSLSKEYGQESLTGMRSARNPGKMKKIKETMNTDYSAKVAAILNADQNAKLKEMEGAPYKDAKKLVPY